MLHWNHFCYMMNTPPPITRNNYDKLVDNLHDPSVLASQQSMKKAALGSEEKLTGWEKIMGLKLRDCYKKGVKLDGSFDNSKQN